MHRHRPLATRFVGMWLGPIALVMLLARQWAGFTVFGGAVAVVTMIEAVVRRRSAIAVHDGGLVVARTWGPLQAFTWDEIIRVDGATVVMHNLPGRLENTTFTVVATGGRTFRFASARLLTSDDLVTSIRSRTGSQGRSEAPGEPLRFGDFEVGPDTIAVRPPGHEGPPPAPAAWADVRDVVTRDDKVVVRLVDGRELVGRGAKMTDLDRFFRLVADRTTR